MKIKNRKINELIQSEYNPRKITKVQQEDLKNSLEKFGVVDPIIINVNTERKNIVIGGHQRLKIWQELGNDEIPCNELNLTLEKEKELNIRLNKNGGSFDDDLLVKYFEYEELIDWGFHASEIFEPDDQELDYSILDNVEIDQVLEQKKSSSKKAIQIEFDPDTYDEAYDRISKLRNKGVNVGALVLDKLRCEKCD